MLFLANIQPDLQRAVREQCTGARFAALDTMNLWIDIARDSLVKTIATVDCLIVNDGEVKQLTDEPNLVRATRKVMEMGPRVVVVKFGEYGSAMYTADGVFGIPAYPTADVVDPTGAGDTFAGGFVGYVAAHADEEITDELLRRAMAYGTALASFNVEAFGTERMQTLDARRGQRAGVASCNASPYLTRRAGPAARRTSCGAGSRGLDHAVPVRVPEAADSRRLTSLVGDPPDRRRGQRARRRRIEGPPRRPHPRRPRQSAPAAARRPGLRRPPRAAATHPLRDGRGPRPRTPSVVRAAGTPAAALAFRVVPTSVLSDGTIRRLVDEGRIVIKPWDPSLVQPASVDLRLGDSFRVFHNHKVAAIDLRDGPPASLTEEVVVTREEGFVIHPGEFCLGRTEEWVELPDDVVARIEGKSLARAARA